MASLALFSHLVQLVQIVKRFIIKEINSLPRIISFVLLVLLSSCKSNNYYVTHNSFERHVEKCHIADKFQEGFNSFDIKIDYPQLTGLRDELLQKRINDSLRFKFLQDFNEMLSTENTNNILSQNTEITYNYYLSRHLFSVLSQEITSSDTFAGNTIEVYNVDIDTGRFLTNEDLIADGYFDQITNIVLEKNFLNDNNANNAEDYQDQYKYYSSMKEEIFNRFKIQILKDSVVFIFHSDSGANPHYYVEIPKEKVMMYFNRKYI